MTTNTGSTILGKALSEQAIRNVNFFNGRLVTSRDMARTQEAQREADARLGQAMGAGIVRGLEIGIDNTAQRQLSVTAGLAISAAGQTLCLGAAQVVALAPTADATAPVSAGGFGRCGVLSGGGYVADNGLYLLTLAPVMVDEGKAPVLALEPGNARCNTDAVVEAVQFRLLRVEATLLASLGLDANPVGAAALSKWRSAVAYSCFGYPGLQNAHALLGTAPASGSLLDAMRLGALSDCDVPLALVYMTGSQGIAFIDAWAVRRRVAGEPASQTWSAWFGPGLDALGEAQLAQFQQQLTEIPGGSLVGLKAGDWFSWLPPAGFLDATGARQLDGRTFLDTLKPARTVPLAPGDVRALLSQALRRDSVKLDGGTQPRFRLYAVDGGPQLFVREAPNAPHAEEVWLDGERARLPGINDVQSAIDALRGRVCGELSVWPELDVQKLIDGLRPGADLHLCFEAGHYDLKRPLRLEGLGHVIVHGGGLASVLECAEAESALIIANCGSATVSELTLAGGSLGRGKTDLGSGLMGALTVIDVPQVHIERVAATCLSGAELGAACIVVRQTALGVEGAKERKTSGEALGKLGLGQSTHACISDCELAIGAAQLGILCVNNDLTDVRRNRLNTKVSKRPAERGIVVAGSQAIEVSIEHNSVINAAQGIAIGLSRNDSPEGKPLSAERATVSFNKVQVALGERDRNRNRFGIFVGNANSLLLEGNRVQAIDANFNKILMESIRLNGVFGLHLVVRANHMSDTPTGIRFTPQAPLPKEPTENGLKSCLWLFDANLAEKAEEVIRMDASVAPLVVKRDNLSV